MDEKDVSVEIVAMKILFVRGKKVMLDRDLAQMYGVKTKRLNEQVRRNLKRFPETFMFQLTEEEVRPLRSQNAALNDILARQSVTSSKRGKHQKYLPCVFTEQGVAMLSSVLNSEQAIQVNIAIMQAFVKLRELSITHKELADKIDNLEKKYQLHETDIQAIFHAIRKLLEPPQEPPKPPIGFR